MSKLYIHPIPVRIWHWTNAIGFVAMIVTGLQIRYSDLMHLMSFRTAVVAHNWIGFVLIANFFLWLCFHLFTDKIKVWHPELSPRKHFRDSIRQIIFYGYGIFRGDPNPHHATAYRKFNALQASTYQIIMMLLVPAQIFTGLLLWDVTRFSSMVEMLGGGRVVDTVHVVLFIVFSGFIIVHVYLGTLGHTPTAHFKAMLTGYEDVEGEPEAGRPV